LEVLCAKRNKLLDTKEYPKGAFVDRTPENCNTVKPADVTAGDEK
jgi:hypothetical protein